MLIHTTGLTNASAFLSTATVADFPGASGGGEVLAVNTMLTISRLRGTALWQNLMSSGSEDLISQYENVVLRTAAVTADFADAAIAIVRVPRVPAGSSAAGQDSSTGMLVGINNKNVTFPFVYVRQPENSAEVRMAKTASGPLQSGLGGGVTVTATLSRFAIVQSPSQIEVLWGDKKLSPARLVRSDSSTTIFTLNVPEGDPGILNVLVYPVAFPANNASFLFTYVDDRLPEILSVSPSTVYDSGTQELTVTIVRLPVDANTRPSLVTVKVSSQDGSVVNANATSIMISPTSRQTATIRFRAPAGIQAGSGLVALSAAGKSSNSFTVEVIVDPTTPPVVSTFSQTSGLCNTEPRLRAILRNMRRADFSSNVSVSVMASNVSVGARVASVTSTYTQTLVDFIVPKLGDYAGNLTITIWNRERDSLRAHVAFYCMDTRTSQFAYAFPASFEAGRSARTVELALDNFEMKDQWLEASGIQLLSWDGQSTSISLERVVSSNQQRTLLRVSLASSKHGTFFFSAAPCASCVYKNVTFDYVFLDPNFPRIIDFSPTSEYIYGHTRLTVLVDNLNRAYDSRHLVVEMGGRNVSVINVVHPLSSGSGESGEPSAVTCMLPDVPSARSVRHILHVVPDGLSLVFPASFVYMRPPQMSMSVVPNMGDLTQENVLQITVHNFPGVKLDGGLAASAFSRIAVEFQTASDSVVPGTVVGYTRLDQRVDEAAVQSIQLLVKSPVGEGVVEGRVNPLRVYNKQFPEGFAEWYTFAFVDPSTPQVVSMQGGGARGSDSLRVPMSVPTMVTIVVANAPTIIQKQSVRINDQEVGLDFFASDSAKRSAQAVLTMAVSNEVTTVYGMIAFGDVTDARCTTQCCATRSCSSVCGSVKTTCFALSVFDDLVPSIVSVSRSTGPEVGGSEIAVVIDKFPQLTEASFATAEFGSETDLGQVVLTSYTPAQTRLSIISPPVPMEDGASSKLVNVRIVPTSYSNRAVEFKFLYFLAKASIERVNPTAGSDKGGTQVFAEIEYFSSAMPLVLFGSDQIQDSSVRLWPSASRMRSRISFITPHATPGLQTVQILPKNCQSPCAKSVSFRFLSVDSSMPVLQAPVPTTGPFQRQRLSVSILLLPAVTNVNEQVNVTFTAADGSVSLASLVLAPVVDDRNVSILTFGIPVGQREGRCLITITVTINQGFPKTLSFPFSFYDGQAMYLVSQTPAQLPTAATANGLLYNLQPKFSMLIANFPAGVSRSDVSVVFTETSMVAEVLSVSDVSRCGMMEIDCNRTLLEILPPSQAVSGDKRVHVRVGTAFLAVDVKYNKACDYDTFCGMNFVVDFFTVMASPQVGAATACVTPASAICVSPEKIPEPVVMSVSPSRGFVTGGTVVSLGIRNLPALVPEDVTVQLTTNSGSVIHCSVLSLVRSGAASLTSSTAVLRFRTPAVAGQTDMVSFRVSSESPLTPCAQCMVCV
jgi:hypothetical protein